MNAARRFGWMAAGAIAVAAAVVWRARDGQVGPESSTPPSSAAPAAPPPPLAALGRARSAEAPPTSTDPGPAVVEPPVEAPTPAPRTVTVTLLLRRSDGRPVERATVRNANDEVTLHPWDPQTITLVRPEGRQILEVLGGRFGEWRQPEDLAIDVRAGMAAVEVTLRPWRMVVGHLTVAAGGPAVKAEARLRSVRTGDQEQEDRREQCAVDLGPPADGWFSFGRDSELEPGTYEVSASPWESGPVRATQRVEVRDGAVFVELDLPRADPADGVVVEVLGPDGRPHTPSLVTVDVRDAQGGGGFGKATAEPIGDGRLWIPTLLPGYSGQPPVEVTIRVHSTEYGERSIDVPVRRGVAPIVVRFEAPAQLTFVLGSRPEWLREGAEVSVWLTVRNGTLRIGAGVLSSDGSATIRGLQPGSVQCVVDGQGPAQGLRVGLASLVLHSGENHVSVAAPVLHPVRIHGAEGVIVVRATDGSGTQGFVDMPAGEEVLRLPPGTYELRSGGRMATVVVPGLTELTLMEPPPR